MLVGSIDTNISMNHMQRRRQIMIRWFSSVVDELPTCLKGNCASEQKVDRTKGRAVLLKKDVP